jgi:hypothetical protein
MTLLCEKDIFLRDIDRSDIDKFDTCLNVAFLAFCVPLKRDTGYLGYDEGRDEENRMIAEKWISWIGQHGLVDGVQAAQERSCSHGL